MIITNGKLFRVGTGSTAVLIPHEIVQEHGLELGQHIEFTINDVYVERVERESVLDQEEEDDYYE